MKFLPHVFTLLNLFCGYLSLFFTLKEEYFRASVAIFASLFFDVFDGRIARISGSASRFGKELDSLADLVSFGVAPSLLIYRFSLSGFGREGFLSAFLFTACVALRLARFNLRSSSTSYFEGLPSPAGGILLASIVLLILFFNVDPKDYSLFILLGVCLSSFLMISPLKYPSMKELRLRGLSTFYLLVLFLFLFVFTASKPPVIAFALAILYLLLGPLLFLKEFSAKIWHKRKKIRNKPL